MNPRDPCGPTRFRGGRTRPDYAIPPDRPSGEREGYGAAADTGNRRANQPLSWRNLYWAEQATDDRKDRPVTTEEVYRAHVASFTSGNLDALMADYADDAVIHTQNGVVRGASDIRDLFTGLLQIIPPGTELIIDTESIENDVVFVVWHVDDGPIPLPFVTDTHIIRDGKIAVQTVAVHLAPPGAP